MRRLRTNAEFAAYHDWWLSQVPCDPYDHYEPDMEIESFERDYDDFRITKKRRMKCLYE